MVLYGIYKYDCHAENIVSLARLLVYSDMQRMHKPEKIGCYGENSKANIRVSLGE